MTVERPSDTGPCTVVVCKYQPELLAALLDSPARAGREVDVCLVLERAEVVYKSPDQALLARCRKVYTVGSFDSLAELSAVAVDLRLTGAPVIRVCCQDELSQFGAGYLRQLLDDAPPDPRFHVAYRDKRLMKQLVAAAGVPVTGFRSLADAHDADTVAAVARELTAPLIVKPAAGFGTSSTVKVDDPAELGPAATGLAFDQAQRSRQLIVEEFVPGDEVCVDAIWSGGKELTFLVHRYLRPRITVLENALDGSIILAPEEHPGLYERLRDMHARINPALGIEDGPTHLEVFSRPDGELVFSEIATRAGGAWVQYMIGAFHGRSTWSLLADSVLTGGIPPLNRAKAHIGGVSIRPTKPGVITGVPTDEELLAFPGTITWHRRRSIGERARLTGPSDWYFFLIVGADTAEELLDTCVRAVRTFTIETDAA
ncbi:ATP-grasp domain-containing protein [Saccharothrix variisporea]|uniref:ATP-grasp domain-containing protein n=1 Tax=Saccharothrix variisporea TaxID=543527 RepID=A0A495X6Q8_9PSEU|nr:ATP-grasp domain-containing protein [Saccharothrix variisporea]RKT69219.1 ATP-grasp domain-containing protein [Saccharothrix variisporea]